MDRALRDILVPALKARGFRGSMPHFRRKSSNGFQYLSIQFSSAGGSFVVEIASMDPSRQPTANGRGRPPEKLNVTYFGERLRLGSRPVEGESDHWFQFGPKSYDPAAAVASYGHFLSIATAVESFLASQAEQWWQSRGSA